MQRGPFFFFFTADNMGEASVRVAAVLRPPSRPEGFSGLVPQQISLFSRSGGDSRGGAGWKASRPIRLSLGQIEIKFPDRRDRRGAGACMGPFPPGRAHDAAGHLGNKSLRK